MCDCVCDCDCVCISEERLPCLDCCERVFVLFFSSEECLCSAWIVKVLGVFYEEHLPNLDCCESSFVFSEERLPEF